MLRDDIGRYILKEVEAIDAVDAVENKRNGIYHAQLLVSIAGINDIASLAQLLQLSHQDCLHKSSRLAVLRFLNHSLIV